MSISATTKLIGLIVRQIVLAQMVCRIEISLCSPFLKHVLSLPFEFFDRRATGDVFARTNDASHISTAISTALAASFPDLLFLAIAACLLMRYSTILAVTVLCFMPLYALSVLPFLKPLVNKEREIKEHLSEWAKRFIESLQNIRTLKAFSAGAMAFEQARSPYIQMQNQIKGRTITSETMGAFCGFVSSLVTIALLFVGAKLTLQRHLPVGEVMFFFSISGLFLGVVNRLAPSILFLQEAMIAVERL